MRRDRARALVFLRCRAVVTLTLLAIVLGAKAPAGSLRKIWEVSLRKTNLQPPPDKLSELPVFALRFSPDGQQLAAVLDEYGPAKAPKSRLLIINVQQPTSEIRQFEINAGIEDDNRGARDRTFEWTASGDAIDAGGLVVLVTAKKACEGEPPTTGSTGSEQNVLSVKETLRSVPKFLVLDAACLFGSTWRVPDDWDLQDISPDRRLLCVSRRDPYRDRPAEFLVVDAISQSILRSWPISVIHSDSEPIFADGGRVVCGGEGVSDPKPTPLRCWDVESGKQVAEASMINGGLPFAAAAHATRIVASDNIHVSLPLSHFPDDYGEVLRRRVIWDFKSGQVLASWHPESQAYKLRDTVPPTPVKQTVKFAISPDGQYIVEGGNGILRLWRVEP